MSASQHSLILFAGIAAVLLVASAAGYALHRRLERDGPNPTVQNLNARIKAWWAMVALIAVAFQFGRAGVILLFAFVSFTAMREAMTLVRTRRGDHYALAAAFYVVLPIQYALVWSEWYGLFTVFIPVYVFLMLPIVAVLRGEVSGFLTRIAEVQWGLMVAVFCVSHVPALLTLAIPGYEGHSLLLICFLVVVVQSSDVLQYVWGKLLGRHKVAPSVSPSKTWEGLVGGVASATLLGAGLWWMTPFTPLQAGGMALVITVMGFFGGLVMSAVKRDRGVKDWGRLIEGHGGMMDRIDSVVFAAPVFFHLVRYWWTV
jgi:phosphatidate cytidylyltransferase